MQYNIDARGQQIRFRTGLVFISVGVILGIIARNSISSIRNTSASPLRGWPYNHTFAWYGIRRARQPSSECARSQT